MSANLFAAFDSFLQRKHLKHELWIIVLSVALGALVYLEYIRFLEHPLLTRFSDRSIGIAIVSGMDAAKRVPIYIGTLFGFFAVSGGMYLCLLLLNAFISKSGKSFHVRIEKSAVTLLSAFSLLAIIYAIVTRDKHLNDIIVLLLTFVSLIFLIILIKIISSHKKQLALKLYSDYGLLIFGMSIPYILLFVYWVVFDKELIFTGRHLLWYAFCTALFFLCYPLLINKIAFKQWRSINNALILAGLPLVWIPASIPLANELQFTISDITDISPQSISLLCMLSLFVISVFMGFYALRKSYLSAKSLSTSKIIAYGYFPAFIISLASFQAHEHILHFPFMDLHHMGEASVPVQQLFSFQSLPFVDIFPSHGLSEMAFQTLYSLVNGYRGEEQVLWVLWLDYVIGALLFYFFISKLFTPLFGLLAAALLPLQKTLAWGIGSYFHPNSQFHISVIALFIFLWVIKKPDFFRYSLLWACMIFMVMWRYDTGIAGIICFLAVIFGRQVRNESHLKGGLINFAKTPVLSLLCMASAALLCYGFIASIRGESFFGLMEQFFAYIAIQSSQAFPLYREFSWPVVFVYAVQPLVLMSFLLYFIWKIYGKHPLYAKDYWLAWIAVFLLVTFTRILARHTLYEHETLTFSVFPLLVCMIPLYFTRLRKQHTQLLFLTLFLIIGIMTDRLGLRSVKKHLFEFRHWTNKENRLMINQQPYAGLVAFINRNLKHGETFYDFTNSPMLYLFSNRKFPVYILPSFHTSDQVQGYALEKLAGLYKKNLLPLVIFKQNGASWSAVDGVANEIRNYSIAEFIYTHYVPSGMLDDYQIWRARQQRPYDDGSYSHLLPYKGCGQFKLNDMAILSCDVQGENMAVQSGKHDPFMWDFLELGAGIPLDDEKRYWLKIRYTSSESGLFQVFYSFNQRGFNGENSMTATLRETNRGTSQEVVVSIPVTEPGSVLSDVRFDPPNDSRFEVQRVELTELPDTDSLVMPLLNISQQFNLQKLPYIWGTYDARNAAGTTKVLETIALPEQKISPEQPIILKINAAIDKTSGNYLHLKIHSKRDGAVTVRYGVTNPAQISFWVGAFEKDADYLLRISSQWTWMSEPISEIFVETSVPITIQQALIRKGDL